MAPLDVEVVIGALSQLTEACPAQAMLCDALPLAAVAEGGALHPYQARILGEARAALDRARTAAEAARLEAGAASRATWEELKSAEELQASFAATYEAALRAVDATAAEKDVHSAAVAPEEEAHAHAVASTAAVIDTKARLEADRARLGAIAAVVERAKGESLCGADAPAAVADLLRRQRAEAALVAAAPRALSLAPSDRSDFDALAVDAAARVLGGALRALEAELAACAAPAAHAEAERLGAWAVAERARDGAAAARLAHGAAGMALEEATAQHEAARTLFAERQAAMSAAMVEEALAEHRLRLLGESVAACERLAAPSAAERLGKRDGSGAAAGQCASMSSEAVGMVSALHGDEQRCDDDESPDAIMRAMTPIAQALGLRVRLVPGGMSLF